MNEDALTPSSVVAPEGATALAGSPGVGEQLRAARKARVLEVTDVAQALKLGARQVEALENGDWEALPGQTFIRGVVRNYARLVQIDALPLMAQLDLILKKPDYALKLSESTGSSMSRGASFGAPRRDRLVVVFGLLLVIVAALAYFLLAKDLSSLRESAQASIDSLANKDRVESGRELPAAPKTPDEPVFPPGTTIQQVINPQALVSAETDAKEAVATNEGPPKEVSPAAAKEAHLRFVANKESWVEVRDRDGRVVFSERLAPASERLINADGPLSLVIGYAPGVKVFLRGEPLELLPHTRADVARLVVE
jgi:cytoskeleton protein RodZ